MLSKDVSFAVMVRTWISDPMLSNYGLALGSAHRGFFFVGCSDLLCAFSDRMATQMRGILLLRGAETSLMKSMAGEGQ